jgi:hypothetical protein
MSNEFEQDTEYLQMIHALPQEGAPSALLEERTVRELRSRGLLRRQRSLPMAWLVGSTAASIALFATGVAVGQWLGTRTTISTVAEIANQTTTAAAAAQVQRTGTAYVQALEALVNSANQTQGQASDRQAREVALTALHAAANEVVRLAPNDPVAAKILQGIEQSRRQADAQPDAQASRKIVWF